VKASFDYYRPITIQYVSDSVKTQKGYVYNYRTLSTGTLNSIKNNSFSFENTIAKKLKISINNQDNQPLKINAVNVKGNVYTMAIRFTEPATYFLAYGNSIANKPNYDIERFTVKTPESMNGLTLQEEQIISKKPLSSKTPLFENKIWLWFAIILTIALLGWFSIKMMKSK
jgi:hypothetical protein